MLRSIQLLRAPLRLSNCGALIQSCQMANSTRIRSECRGSTCACQKRHFSNETDVALSSLSSGGRLFLNFKSVKYADVKIHSAWTDHVVVEEIIGDDKNPISNIANGSVQSQSSLRSVKLVRRPGESNYLSLEPITATDTGAESDAKLKIANSALRLRITVPERVDIDLQGNCVDLNVSNKVLGNLNVDMTGGALEDEKLSPMTDASSSKSKGSISLDKYRGESIVIRAPKAPFSVKTALEGANVYIDAASFDVPLVHSKHVVVKAADKIKVGAMYTSSFSGHADGPINIGFIQGLAKLSSRTGPITVGNLQGALDATVMDESTMTVNINELSVGTQSILKALKGSIAVNFNDKINANLVSSITGVRPAQSPLEAKNDATSGNAAIDISGLRGFHASPSSTPVHTEGRITGSDIHSTNKTPSRKFTSGKINVRKELDNLNDREALKRAFEEYPGATEADSGLSMHSAHHAGSLGAATALGAYSAAGSESAIPRITVSAGKGVTVRTRTWIDAIKEKHGVK